MLWIKFLLICCASVRPSWGGGVMLQSNWMTLLGKSDTMQWNAGITITSFNWLNICCHTSMLLSHKGNNKKKGGGEGGRKERLVTRYIYMSTVFIYLQHLITTPGAFIYFSRASISRGGPSFFLAHPDRQTSR